MKVTLDGIVLFGDGEAELEVGSFYREFLERAAGGLDGVMSIDLGGRGRKIKQKGELRARSTGELNSKVEAISSFVDGDTHTLATSQGEAFENIRVDSVSVRNKRVSGSGVAAEYEIIYKQLAVQ